MATSRSEYEVALKQAEAELASHDARGEALRAAVEALKGLVAAAPAKRAPARKPARRKAAKKKVVKRKAKARVKRPRKSAGAGQFDEGRIRRRRERRRSRAVRHRQSGITPFGARRVPAGGGRS